MKYRADIDGLRAVAVLAVVFYHLGFTTFFASGYIGVDIFFVISGYLITTIIYKEMLENSFSFGDFYERRIRRIFPVFLFVLLASLLFAYCIAFYDMRNFLNSLFSALIMGGNFYFWKDLDYFALPSHMKPLLHTWSLGVEEQFYVIFPIILLFLLKRKYSPILTLSVLWLISLIICIMQSNSTADTAFYLLPYRLWELLTGGILAIYIVQGKNFLKNSMQVHMASILAVVLFIFSINYLEVIDYSFPSFLPIFACFATSLCIAMGNLAVKTDSYLTKFLSFPLLTCIGKISFSLYLWHWVVIVFARELVILESHELPLKVAFSCLAISFALSIFSYFVIEQPIRKKRFLANRKHLFIAMFALSAVVALLALAIKKEILPLNISEDVHYYNSIENKNSYAYNFVPEDNKIENIPLVFFGDKTKEPTLLVLGDSHARHHYLVLDELAKEYNVSGLLASETFLFNAYESGSGKEKLENTMIVKEYLERYEISSVLISFRWTCRMYGEGMDHDGVIDAHLLNYHDQSTKETVTDGALALNLSINDTIEYFSKTNTAFFMQGILPEFAWQIPARASKAVRRYPKTSQEFREIMSIPYEKYIDFNNRTFKVLDEIVNKHSIQYIDLSKKLCDDTFCYGTAPDGTVYFYDDDHFAIDATMLFEEELLPFILAGKK